MPATYLKIASRATFSAADGLLDSIEGLGVEKAGLESALAGPPPSPVRLHPNLTELYREKVTALRASLADPAINDEAIGMLRGLIEQVVLWYDTAAGTSSAVRDHRAGRARPRQSESPSPGYGRGTVFDRGGWGAGSCLDRTSETIGGTVTLTAAGEECSYRTSGDGNLAPGCERLRSEFAMGGQVALKIQVIIDCGIGGEEPLRRARRSESAPLSLSRHVG
jgi:hypothetical protein